MDQDVLLQLSNNIRQAMSSANSQSNVRWEFAHTKTLVGEFIGRMPDRDGAKRNRGYTVVYIKYIEYRKVHVSKRKIPRNRKVSGVFLLS